MDKPCVALFDFDGTITSADTLPLFIRHATGWGGYLLSTFITFPRLVILACAGWQSVMGIDAGNTKEKLLHRCFAGKSINEIARLGKEFVPVINRVLAPCVMEKMRWHIDQGHKVVIVTASVDVWVAPWACENGVHHVIATRLQHDGEKYTGAFQGKNCNGKEKALRIATHYPHDQYHLIAYGNSSGDYPMFDYAHEAYLCRGNKIERYK